MEFARRFQSVRLRERIFLGFLMDGSIVDLVADALGLRHDDFAQFLVGARLVGKAQAFFVDDHSALIHDKGGGFRDRIEAVRRLRVGNVKEVGAERPGHLGAVARIAEAAQLQGLFGGG